METQLEKLNITSYGESMQCLSNEFVNIMGHTKKRKQAVKILKTVDSDAEFFSNVEKYLGKMLSSQDILLSKKVSSLMELSSTTRDIVRRNFKHLCTYLVQILSTVCDEEETQKKFPNSERFNECTMLAVKLCLHVTQFLPDEVTMIILNTGDDIEAKEQMELICAFILTVLCCKRFTKECSLLAGTTFALLFNLCERNYKTMFSITSLLETMDKAGSKQIGSIMLGGISVECPKEVSSSYSPLMLINGFVSINSSLLLEETSSKQLLLDSVYNVIKATHFNNPVSKYLCFQTLLAWLNFICNVSINKLLAYYKDGRSLFLKKDSGYCYEILDWVWKHIEDLVDGIPLYVQKIFASLLKLHAEERSSNNAHRDDEQFYLELTKDVLNQSWHVKGRWSLLTELIPFINFKKVFSMQPYLADELIQCMTTCGLTAVSNDVYQAILKDMRNSSDHDKAAVIKDWTTYFKHPIMKALQSDNILLRQNIGQYWIPSTVRILPDCLLVTEGDLRSKLMDNKVSTNSLLHAYILIVKSCRNSALIRNDRLEQCKELLAKALQHSDIDIRIETFDTLCSNPKKTEPLPISFQQLLLNFVEDNLNNDSSRCRQQMLSSLKKLLLNIRDSSVMLHRRHLNEEKKGISDGSSKYTLMKLIDFVEGFLVTSKSCLHPGALFQRRKTGLLLFQLISDIFIYVKDDKLRKKGGATDSCEAFFKFIHEEKCGLEVTKLNILCSADVELLSCIEDQHDEVRDLALEILNYHQVISRDRLLSTKETFDATVNIALSLLDSPKYYETESGAKLIRFITSRLIDNKCIGRHLEGNDQLFAEKPLQDEDNYMALCYMLLNRGKNFLKKADEDFLSTACYRPIYGILLAFSEILKSFENLPRQPGLKSFIKELVTFCDSVCSMTVHLLAGTYVGKKNLGNDCTEASPSFADIDEALDTTLKQCPSYIALRESIGHLHCRELLVSFCWLNLKAISSILSAIGNLVETVKSNELLIHVETLGLIYKYYKNSLIKCRHKGVIESALLSLTSFAKSLASTTSYWKEMVIWCFDVLQSAVDLSQNASVTKRSAGIPMFIQAILSAEPMAENALLHKCMNYLLIIAKQELPTDINLTVDLPQFNAINIMKAIFRDASLGNMVLPFVEDAVMLTINGFSSPSWSIRNASTILLGTLVPRMLGQRISQEENNLQNTSTIDVFFYRYPKLVSYFQSCLDSQIRVGKDYGSNFISPHVIPALTFLSKLSSSNGDKCTRLSSTFLPILNSFIVSPVFFIRELATSSIISFTPEEGYLVLAKETLTNLLDETNNNKIHSLSMLLLKLLGKSRNSRGSICTAILQQYKNGGCICRKINRDLLSVSLTIDILVECFHTSKSDAVDILLEHLKIYFSFTERLVSTSVGKPVFLKSLVKAIVTVLCEDSLTEEGSEIISQLQRSCCKDLHMYFFKYVNENITSIQDSFKIPIFSFTVKSILESKCRILLEHSISCFKSLLDKRTFYGLMSIRELLERLLGLLNTSLRLVPFLLPTIEKLLNYVRCRNPDSFTVDVYLTMADRLANSVMKYSSAEEGEDLRCASASSLGLLRQLVVASESCRNKTLLKRAIQRILTSAVRLLQDEDEYVRLQANSHLQFVNTCGRSHDIAGSHDIDEGKHDVEGSHCIDVQCNITLKRLVKFVEVNALNEEMFFSWLVGLFARSDPGEYNKLCDLMLFEQEASNLYAEETIIIDLVYESLKGVLSQLSKRSEAGELFMTYSRLFKESAHAVCKKDVNWLKSKFESYARYPRRSVYGLFGSRKCFITVYKTLKWLEILHLCICDEAEEEKIKELYLNELLSIVEEYSMHPAMKEICDVVVSKYHVM